MPKRTLCYLARSAHAFCACTQASFRTLTNAFADKATHRHKR